MAAAASSPFRDCFSINSAASFADGFPVGRRSQSSPVPPYAGLAKYASTAAGERAVFDLLAEFDPPAAAADPLSQAALAGECKLPPAMGVEPDGSATTKPSVVDINCDQLNTPGCDMPHGL